MKSKFRYKIKCGNCNNLIYFNAISKDFDEGFYLECNSCGGKIEVLRRTCPYCLEKIKPGAVKCKHCGGILVEQKAKKSNWWVWWSVGLIIFLILRLTFNHFSETATNTVSVKEGYPSTKQKEVIVQTNNDDIIIEKIKQNVIYIKYDFSGKNVDGSYFERQATGSGVVVDNESELTVFTNRHVVDCGFTDDCFQRLNEEVSVRTQDGKLHRVSKVSFASHNLDIAVLKVDNAKSSQVEGLRDDLKVGEQVIAIGYPSYADRVLEFRTAKGKITALKELIMKDGFPFESIESDAYTYYGSSGGGLFDEYGNLIGIITWGNSKESIAIKITSLKDALGSFFYCESGSYPAGDTGCIQYCEREEVLGKEGRCYGVCTDYYCESQKIMGDDPRCNNGYIAGQDDYCHPPCGYPTKYCDVDSICYKNSCIPPCPYSNQRLFKDGTCRYYE